MSSEAVLIPIWKLKRELARIADQIMGLPQSIASLPARVSEPRRRRMHDAAFPHNLGLTDGTVTPAGRIAMLVLYQPTGLSASTFDTCRALLAGGYAPLVISNAPLSDAEKTGLAKISWRVVERPNFGYDFGAYRDGIRLIQTAGLSPDRLVLMNDSIWCEITPSLLSRIEGLEGDLTGLIQDEKVKHDIRGGTPTDRVHIESYFLMVSGNLWRSAAFNCFWSEYPMSSFKQLTIKAGEIRFSHRMRQAGFHLNAVASRDRFLADLSRADNDELHCMLRYAAYDDILFQRQGDALLHRPIRNEDWRNDVLDHVRRWVNRRRFNAAFPLASARIFGTAIIKKSEDQIFVAARAAYLKAIEAGDLAPPPSSILTELRTWDADRKVEITRQR